jgi:hypothetical protein
MTIADSSWKAPRGLTKRRRRRHRQAGSMASTRSGRACLRSLLRRRPRKRTWPTSQRCGRRSSAALQSSRSGSLQSDRPSPIVRMTHCRSQDHRGQQRQAAHRGERDTRRTHHCHLPGRRNAHRPFLPSHNVVMIGNLHGCRTHRHRHRYGTEPDASTGEHCRLGLRERHQHQERLPRLPRAKRQRPKHLPRQPGKPKRRQRHLPSGRRDREHLSRQLDAR